MDRFSRAVCFPDQKQQTRQNDDWGIGIKSHELKEARLTHLKIIELLLSTLRVLKNTNSQDEEIRNRLKELETMIVNAQKPESAYSAMVRAVVKTSK